MHDITRVSWRTSTYQNTPASPSQALHGLSHPVWLQPISKVEISDVWTRLHLINGVQSDHSSAPASDVLLMFDIYLARQGGEKEGEVCFATQILTSGQHHPTGFTQKHGQFPRPEHSSLNSITFPWLHVGTLSKCLPCPSSTFLAPFSYQAVDNQQPNSCCHEFEWLHCSQ